MSGSLTPLSTTRQCIIRVLNWIKHCTFKCWVGLEQDMASLSLQTLPWKFSSLPSALKAHPLIDTTLAALSKAGCPSSSPRDSLSQISLAIGATGFASCLSDLFFRSFLTSKQFWLRNFLDGNVLWISNSLAAIGTFYFTWVPPLCK